MMRPMSLAAAAGLLLALALILSQGAASVFAAVASVGAGALWIIVIRSWQIAGAGDLPGADDNDP